MNGLIIQRAKIIDYKILDEAFFKIRGQIAIQTQANVPVQEQKGLPNVFTLLVILVFITKTKGKQAPVCLRCKQTISCFLRFGTRNRVIHDFNWSRGDLRNFVGQDREVGVRSNTYVRLET